MNGIYFSDSERAERLKQAQKQEQASQPLLADAFKALGFDPEPLGAERDGKAVKPKKRPRTRDEKVAEGLGKEAAADHSPYAHDVQCSFAYFFLFVVFVFFVSVAEYVTPFFKKKNIQLVYGNPFRVFMLISIFLLSSKPAGTGDVPCAVPCLRSGDAESQGMDRQRKCSRD